MLPRTMCSDPVCTVAEVWSYSEHYLWLFDGSFLVGGIDCSVFVIVPCFLRFLKLCKLAQQASLLCDMVC